jgi:pantoate--beta-alanine ligase
MAPTLLRTIDELRAKLDTARASGATVGFTPTMGYLHDGHASLMRAARQADDVVVASIFVNPLQFAPDEDLSTYPRDLEADLEVAAEAGADLVFAPSVDEMYPFGPVLTTVSVAEITQRWEGASRPTHFAGVATVVAKLFALVGPCRAYFGEKDYQQLAVIRRMAADLSFPVEVVGCPTVREPDGLAMSSRNVLLEPADRAAAVVLRRSLDAGVAAMARGEADPDAVTAAMAEVVAAEPRAALDYVAAVDPLTLAVPERLGPEARLLIAASVGRPRLIDNCPARLGPDSPPTSSFQAESSTET